MAKASKAYQKAKKTPLGSGKRSAAIKSQIMGQGKSAAQAGAIVGAIGRKKYGNKKMASLSAKGRSRSK